MPLSILDLRGAFSYDGGSIDDFVTDLTVAMKDQWDQLATRLKDLDQINK
jgi:hypothetical protein